MLIDDNRAQRVFACLGDPSRFRVVATLSMNEHCVTDLARRIGLSQSCTTRHLQVLQREGLVVGFRKGKRVIFRLNLEEPMVAGLVAWVSGGIARADDRSREAAASRPSSKRDETPDGPSPRRDLEDFLL